jgi:hypothetical protein
MSTLVWRNIVTDLHSHVSHQEDAELGAQRWHITSWRKPAKELTTLGLPPNLERSKSNAAKFPVARTSLSLAVARSIPNCARPISCVTLRWEIGRDFWEWSSWAGALQRDTLASTSEGSRNTTITWTELRIIWKCTSLQRTSNFPSRSEINISPVRHWSPHPQALLNM